jgi:hypothetical protein
MQRCCYIIHVLLRCLAVIVVVIEIKLWTMMMGSSQSHVLMLKNHSSRLQQEHCCSCCVCVVVAVVIEISMFWREDDVAVLVGVLPNEDASLPLLLLLQKSCPLLGLP